MASTTFVDFVTPVPAAWLNDVNTAIYTAIGTGGGSPLSPLTPQQVVNNIQYLNSGTGAVTRSAFSKFGDEVSVKDFGAMGNGIADDTTAFNSALAYLESLGGGTLIFPAGIYILSAVVTTTMTTNGASITIVGAGADATELRWTSTSGGLTINYISPGNSAHIRDLSITTSKLNGGNGLFLSQNKSLAQFMNSDITRVNFRGSDNQGGGGLAYWTNCYVMNGVCGTNVIGCTLYGSSSFQGNGAVYQGNAANAANAGNGNGYSIYHNVVGCIFNQLFYGVQYLSYSQGLTISQSNFQNTNTGVYTPPGQTGTLSQLQISCSQLACIANNISILTNIGNVMIYGNDLFSGASSSSILLNIPEGYSIVGNNISTGGGAGTFGITIGPPFNSNQVGVITGNVFLGLNLAIFLETGSMGNNIQSNSYSGNTTNINNLGSGNTLGGGSI